MIMKKLKVQLLSLNLAEKITVIGATIGVFVLIISVLFKNPELTTRSAIQELINFLGSNLATVWGITASFVLIFLLLQYFRIRKQLSLVFIDDFKNPIDHNWDYVGPWRITSDHELLVTGSDEGGLTKKGALWENYVLTFDVKILKKCIGVIIRAKDLQNYYMFQITTDKIRPHRKVSVPILIPSEKDPDKLKVDKIKVGWDIMDKISLVHRKELNTWFKVQVSVNGQSLTICIDNEKVFYRERFLENSYGKIGFRNDITEEALIKNVKVKIN